MAEVEAFVADSAPLESSVAKLADKLLASPAYAQHMASQWLDVARYADSTGYDWDEWRQQSWRYRDYVVRAFQEDKRIDQFIREQLAGDEIAPAEPVNAAQQDMLLATGFLRVGPWDNSSKLFGEEEKTHSQWMADVVETTGSAFLGLTMSCCRCHDHKFDPLSHEDFYRLRAIFEPLEFRDAQPLDLAAEQKAIREQHLQLAKEREPLETQIKQQQKKGESTKETEARVAELRGQERRFTYGLLAGNAAEGAARLTHVLAGGDVSAKRQQVMPGILSYFKPEPIAVGGNSGRRLALADWLVSAENPLTARVLADRIWAAAFGWHLVATPEDFGVAGQPPTHPELLDWLAKDLQVHWSWKTLLRKMVLSSAWQQKRAPQRLTAEALRDNLLAVSGLLTTKAAGPSIWPTVEDAVLQSNPAVLDDNAEKTKGWYPSPEAEQLCRSLFLMKKRSLKVPFLETFDLPDNFVSCAQRQVSTVAPQALTLLNSSLAVKAAKALAQRANGDAATAFTLALQRPPTAVELAALVQLKDKAGVEAVCRALLNLNEFAYVE